MTVDLPGHVYSFPQTIALTEQRPDIVLWSPTSIVIIELTLPFETNISGAVERKMDRYRELRESCSRSHKPLLSPLRSAHADF